MLLSSACQGMRPCLCADPPPSPCCAWDAVSEESTQRLNGDLGSSVLERDWMRRKLWSRQHVSSCSQTPVAGWASCDCNKGHWGRQAGDELMPPSSVFQGIHIVLFSSWQFQKERFSIEISVGNSGFEQPECWHSFYSLTHTHPYVYVCTHQIDAKITWLLDSLYTW